MTRPAVSGWILLTMSFALSSFASHAAAQAAALGNPMPPAPSASPVRVELLGGTTTPIDVGVMARVSFFDRILIGGSIGATVYGAPIGGLVQSYSGAPIGDLVHTLIDGGLALRVIAGVRPFGSDGLELSFAYVHLEHGTSVSSAQIASAFGAQLPFDSVDASVTLHALAGELAWNIVLFDHLLIRPAVGWTQAFAANASLSAAGASDQVAAGLDAAAQVVSAALARYAMTPTASLSIGYRF
jgi:hypothetical protein